MTFKFDHENSSKKYSVDAINEPIDDIKFKSNKNNSSNFDEFREPVPEVGESEEIGLNFIANESKKVDDEEEEEIPQKFNDNHSESDIFMKEQQGYSEEYNEPRLSYEDIQNDKARYLSQLRKLEMKGHVSSRRFGMEHRLSDIKGEVIKIRKDIETDRAVDTITQGLLFCISGIELINTRYDPFGVDLEGWSRSIAANQDSYEDVIEEIYEKWFAGGHMPPEMKLVMMISFSAVSFNLGKQASKPENFGFMQSLMKGFAKPGNKGKSSPQPPNKMKGPSVNTDDLIKSLNNDDFSDVSSVMTEASEKPNEKTISVPQPKKRGRKPKNQK